ncbi:MAG: hypothetical protein U0457_05190 [Candidatus Sericytochromatia bacterium]
MPKKVVTNGITKYAFNIDINLIEKLYKIKFDTEAKTENKIKDKNEVNIANLKRLNKLFFFLYFQKTRELMKPKVNSNKIS